MRATHTPGFIITTGDANQGIWTGAAVHGMHDTGMAAMRLW
jgi:hypothetical protein